MVSGPWAVWPSFRNYSGALVGSFFLDLLLKEQVFGLLVANSLSIRFEINSSVEFLVRITVLVQRDRTALPAFYRICVCMVVAIFLSSLTPSPTPHLHLFFFSVFQEKKEAKSTEWPFFEFGIIQMSSF